MRVVLTISTLFSMLVIAPVSYMTFDVEPPYEFDAANSYIVPRETLAGHQITVHWKLKRINRVCLGTITRNIVDARTGVRVTYDPVMAAGVIDIKALELNRTFYLPQGIAPGEKFYYSDGAYACNFLQRYWRPLLVRTPMLTFEILPTSN